jgi:Skp family chaperone for outer membrane proteins
MLQFCRFVFFIVALLVGFNGCAAWGQSEDRPVTDKWAVVVGISKFADPRLNLHYTAKDASDFYQYLITDGGFAQDHVLLLQDEQATRESILSAIGGKWLPHCALPDDLVVIVFSTHGSCPDPSVEGVNYIVAHDTDVDNIYGTGIAMQDIMRMIKGKVHSERVVMLVDACHSGTIDPQAKQLFRTESSVDPGTILQGCGQIAICSSTPGEVSWESKNYPNSIFIRQLIDGLKSKGSGTTIDDAYQYLKSHVLEEVIHDHAMTQTPVMKSKWQGGKLVLSAPPTQPHAAAAWIPSVSSAIRTLPAAPPRMPIDTANTPGPEANAPRAVPTRAGYFNLAYIKGKFPDFSDAAKARLAAETLLRQQVVASNQQIADAQARHKSKEEIDQLARTLQVQVSTKQTQLVEQISTQEAAAEQRLANVVASVATSHGLEIGLAADSVYVGGHEIVANGPDITNDVCAALGIPVSAASSGIREPKSFTSRFGYFNLAMVKKSVPEIGKVDSLRANSETALRRFVDESNEQLATAAKQGSPRAELERQALAMKDRVNQEQQRLAKEVQATGANSNAILANAAKSAADSAGVTLLVSAEGVYLGGKLIGDSGVDLTNQIINAANHR